MSRRASMIWLHHPKSTPEKTLFADILRVTADTLWMRRALCSQADPEAWFPHSTGSYGGVETARRICRRCPVQRECLDYALKDPDLTGVWGGTSPNARRQIRAGRVSASHYLTPDQKGNT